MSKNSPLNFGMPMMGQNPFMPMPDAKLTH